MKICEIEFASSSIAFSMQIINELELNLLSLEFNYPRTTSVELNSVKRVRVKLNFSQTRDVSKFNFSRSRADVASNIRFVERYAKTRAAFKAQISFSSDIKNLNQHLNRFRYSGEGVLQKNAYQRILKRY